MGSMYRSVLSWSLLWISWATSVERQSGGPGNHPEVLHFIAGRDGDALRPESRDLPAADGSQLDGSDDSVGGDDPEPGKSPGLLGRERRKNEGHLAGPNV